MTTYDSSNFTPSDEGLRRLQEAYPQVYGTTGQQRYSTNQFAGITAVEPFPIDRNKIDNPPFLWPSDQYMDITGTTHKIQRGYMRSLITDPEVDLTRTAKNRRLFFQFNPQVLVRSVQQSVGSMLPLLQDPAQLTQPVPGTTSFGFELMFNREHEVNAGYNNPNTEWLTLPNQSEALVSEIGVLADLMILDTITGQGLSEDMINSVVRQARQKYANINEINAKEKERLKKAGIKAETLDYEPLVVPEESEIKEIFTNNFGNSAFLNPLPFRVLFSSLFMVEGVATSIDVVFQKFSRTMVPTQCKVTINMYALYFGFAKKNTFIFDNLTQAAEDATEAMETDAEVVTNLTIGMEGFSGRMSSTPGNFDVATDQFPAVNNPRFSINNIKVGSELYNYLRQGEVTEANFSFELEYIFTSTNSTQVSDSALSARKVTLTQNGQKDKHNAKETKNVGNLYALMDSGENKSIFQDPDFVTLGAPIRKKYISYRIVLVLSAKSKSGNVVTRRFNGSTVYNLDWTQPVTGSSSVSSFTGGAQ